MYTSAVCVADNWALIYAQQLALAEELPLHICFCLVPRFLDAAYRQYAFMLKGLQEVAKVHILHHHDIGSTHTRKVC